MFFSCHCQKYSLGVWYVLESHKRIQPIIQNYNTYLANKLMDSIKLIKNDFAINITDSAIDGRGYATIFVEMPSVESFRISAYTFRSKNTNITIAERNSRYLCLGVPNSTTESELSLFLSQKFLQLQKGVKHENICFNFLKQLKEESGERIILNIWKTNIQKDRELGIDYIVSFLDRDYQYMEIPLQVKTSASFQDTHKIYYPKVPSVVLREQDSYRIFKEKMIRIINGYMTGKIIHA